MKLNYSIIFLAIILYLDVFSVMAKTHIEKYWLKASDWIICSRLSDTFVIAQKQAISSHIMNNKTLNKKDKSILYFYRGLCHLYHSYFQKAENDFTQALNMNNRQEYDFYKSLAPILSNNDNRQTLQLLKKYPQYNKTVFCRLKGPSFLLQAMPENAIKVKQLEDVYARVLMNKEHFNTKDPLLLLSQNQINIKGCILFDPYAIFYLSQIYKANLEDKNIVRPPDQRTSFTNDTLYLYIHAIENQHIPVTALKRLRKKEMIPPHILDSFLLMTKPKPDFETAYHQCAQHIQHLLLTTNVNPERIITLYLIDFSIASFYVGKNNFHWSYKWILTASGMEERYGFLKAVNIYMGWSLHQ